MKPAEQVAAFVGLALTEGRSRADIGAALVAAGWSQAEIARGLQAWAEGDFTPPYRARKAM